MQYIQLKPLVFLCLFYPFSLNAQVLLESEPNNSFSSADSLSLDSTIQGLLFPNNDDDYYQIPLTQKGLVSIQVNNVPEDVLIRLKLYDSSFSEINFKNGLFGQDLQMDTEVCERGIYYVRVYALEENPQLRYELKVQLDSSGGPLSCLTNLREMPAWASDFKVYPNPADSYFFVDLTGMTFPGEESWFLSLRNARGSLVLRQKPDRGLNYLSLPKLANGLYLLELQTDRGNIYQKIIISNL
ncbi:MAG: T9SS type A sorting domain-containing protein [Bacteroidia bacterium]|nr:T9SS type A sorting domain-containing protein [Bacteroidia bacterium]